MTDSGTLGNIAWRDHVTLGVPSTGVHEPLKSEIRAFVDAVESQKASVVPTLVAFKALTTRPDAVLVKGKTAIFDGWGGVFVWEAGSSTTADDLDVVQCTAGAPGRYKRLRSAAAVNLCPNSDLGICTSLILRRVGSAVSVTAWTTAGGPTGMAQFTTATAAAAGLTNGKLCLLEGPGTPHAPISAVSGTVTSNKRITCASSTFTGVAQGDTCWLTGGSNTSPKGQYRISATNGDTYIELFGYSASMLVNETATYSMTFTQGGYSSAVDATINGIPQAGDPVLNSAIGYPLKVAAITGASAVYATLAGATLSALNTATATMWEVTPGDDFGVTGDAADGWKKTPSLQYYRSYDKDWDGTTAVTLSGSLYGCKLIKGSASVENFSTNLAAANATQRDTSDPRKLAQFKGKTITFGIYWKPPGASKARPFISDGVTTTYGSYYSSGSLNWSEVTAAISASAAYVLVGIALEGSIGDVHYGTQPMAIWGGYPIGAGNYVPTRGKHQFASHPNMPLYVNGPIPSARIIRLEQESLGQLPRGVASIDIGVEGHCSQPGGNTTLDTAALLISDSPTTYIPSITLYQPQERSSLFCSSDTTTVAAGATSYIGQRTLNATEAVAASFMPFYPSGAVALAMYCKCTAAPVGAETFTYTLFKNGIATSIAVVITGAAVAGSYIALGASLANQVTYAPGDSFSVRVVASGGAAVTTHQVAIEVNRISDEHAVNSGMSVVGKYTEFLGLPNDIMYVAPGFAINTGWTGVNIDMFACELGGS